MQLRSVIVNFFRRIVDRYLDLKLFMIILMGMVLGLPTISLHAQEATPDSQPLPNRAIVFHPEETGPGTFVSVVLQPGESTTVNVILGNGGEIEQTIRTYAVPALSATGGGFVLSNFGDETDLQTGWLDYPEKEFTFQPTEGITIPVTITIPNDITSGEYVTGLAAEQTDAFEVPGTDLFLQRVRWSVPVLITVPGERLPSFELGDVTLVESNGALVAEVGIENTGNVIVRPVGEVRLLNGEGSVVGISSVKMDSVYVGTSTTFVVGWDNIPLTGSYSMELSLASEDGSVTVMETRTGIEPTPESAEKDESSEPLEISAELSPLTNDVPPSMLALNAVVINSGDPIENARVSIVAYQDGEEVDRYPIMQALTIQTGQTPVEARYSLPGGFTEGTYTFEVTIELGSGSTQTVLVTQPIDFKVTVGEE